MEGCKNSDISQMKNMGFFLMWYANEHSMSFPDNLSQLMDDRYCEMGIFFVSNYSKTKRPESGNDIKNGQCDLIYFGKGQIFPEYEPSKAFKSKPVVMTKPGIYPDDFVIVTLANGVVVSYQSNPPRLTLIEDLKDKLGLPPPELLEEIKQLVEKYKL